MINKVIHDVSEALEEVTDGASIMVGGQVNIGIPDNLLNIVLEKDVKSLTIIANHAGIGDDGIARLIKNKQVSKIICSFPKTKSKAFENAYRNNEIELELVPQGTLSERIRAGGAGIGGFYTRTGVGTIIEKSKEVKVLNGEKYLLEMPIQADFSLIKAFKGDRWGNLIYNKLARNYNPPMATAGKKTIVEVDEISDEPLDPERVITPGVFVDNIIKF